MPSVHAGLPLQAFCRCCALALGCRVLEVLCWGVCLQLAGAAESAGVWRGRRRLRREREMRVGLAAGGGEEL